MGACVLLETQANRYKEFIIRRICSKQNSLSVHRICLLLVLYLSLNVINATHGH